MGIENKHVHEAYSALFQQDYRRAIQSFRKAISECPKNGTLYYKLSITYARNNQLEKGIESIKEAIRLSGERNDYQLQLQHLLNKRLIVHVKHELRRGRQISSYIAQLEEYIQIDPLDMELRWMLASIYVEQDKFEQAEKITKEILAMDSSHKEALHYIHTRSEGKKNVH